MPRREGGLRGCADESLSPQLTTYHRRELMPATSISSARALGRRYGRSQARRENQSRTALRPAEGRRRGAPRCGTVRPGPGPRLAYTTAVLLVCTTAVGLAAVLHRGLAGEQLTARMALLMVSGQVLVETSATSAGVALAPAPTAAPGAAAPPGALATAAAPDVAATTVPPAAPRDGPLPVGRGMWLWQPEMVEGGNVVAIVERAVSSGLTHLYVRTGSSWQGFHGAAFLDQLLGPAHAAGLRVYGWDFPNLADVGADVGRAVTAINHVTPDGQRIDGFVPDIETSSEGTRLSPQSAAAYGNDLRAAVGAGYPLIVCVPRPSDAMVNGRFPYAEVVAPFDAIAPMVYWLNRQPDTDVAGALAYLAQFNKPVIPVGQAYDGGPEGGRAGPPPAEEIQRFMATAEAGGASGVSFWSWQHATEEFWATYATSPQFVVPVGPVVSFTEAQVRSVQALLASLGYEVALTGVWDAVTASALMLFQAESGAAPTGLVDELTRDLLLNPLLAPLFGR